ncbi:MAG: YHS domain-containing (seleno)protein [Pseudomonadota bacterium]
MKTFFSLALVALLTLSTTTSAENFSPVSTPSPFSTNTQGIAIDGYDPVSYFDDNKAVKGQAAHTCEYGNATWYFSSAENRDRFLADPERFAPQYGGYCAHSISNNKIVQASSKSFVIRDNKLYFYVNDTLSNRDANKSAISFEKSRAKRDKNWLSFERRF